MSFTHLGGELLATDVAGVLGWRRRVVLADVVHEAVLALAHHPALRALFVAWGKVGMDEYLENYQGIWELFIYS